jgi:hypothetical protein
MSARSIRTGRTGVVVVSEARQHQYVYTILRIVTDIERGEQFNAGVVLFSRPAAFIGARVSCDAEVFNAMRGTASLEDVRDRLTLLESIARGDVDGGPVAQLDASERFYFLSAPTSTVIQPSPVHTGVTTDARATLDRLFARLVLRG